MELTGRLTMREIAKVESLSGLPITAAGDEDAPKGKLFAALVYVIKSREDKEFTFDDALDMPMDEIGTVLGLEADEDPKDEN